MKHYKYERTLVVIKPDGIQRSLVGEIIGRYERVGLKLVGIKFFVPDDAFVERHYTFEDGWVEKVGAKSIKNHLDKGLTPPSNDPKVVGGIILANLRKYLTSGPVVAMVWQGAHAVAVVRKLTGGTEPLSSDVGTIRGDFVLDSIQMAGDDNRAIRNLVHSSSSVEEAEKEIDHWFDEKEVLDYRLVQEGILYDVNMDGTVE